MKIREQPLAYLEAYARVSIAFEAHSILDLFPRDGGLGGFELHERPLSPALAKNYDAIHGNHPTDWARRFDLSNWGLLSAELDGRRVGGAAIAFQTPSVVMLEGRSDLAVLWDLQVDPDFRRRALGSALFVAAAGWARARGCRWLKVETQNINVPACKLYAGHGCALGAIHRFAYPELPNEIQLLRYKDLA